MHKVIYAIATYKSSSGILIIIAWKSGKTCSAFERHIVNVVNATYSHNPVDGQYGENTRANYTCVDGYHQSSDTVRCLNGSWYPVGQYFGHPECIPSKEFNTLS